MSGKNIFESSGMDLFESSGIHILEGSGLNLSERHLGMKFKIPKKNL
jgi:hypothetical protein